MSPKQCCYQPFGCGTILTQDTIKKHENACSFRPFNCRLCCNSDPYTFVNYENHLRNEHNITDNVNTYFEINLTNSGPHEHITKMVKHNNRLFLVQFKTIVKYRRHVLLNVTFDDLCLRCDTETAVNAAVERDPYAYKLEIMFDDELYSLLSTPVYQPLNDLPEVLLPVRFRNIDDGQIIVYFTVKTLTKTFWDYVRLGRSSNSQPSDNARFSIIDDDDDFDDDEDYEGDIDENEDDEAMDA